MKNLFILLFLFCTALVQAQNQITGFTVSPQNPTTLDAVTIYANVVFTSGGCDVAEQAHSTNGSITDAYAHHCVGMLAVICPTTDTFELGTLEAGQHTFRMALTSGGAPAPCTPGIIADDLDSVVFQVTPVVGINQTIKNENHVIVFPNPFTEQAVIVFQQAEKLVQPFLVLTDIQGKQVQVTYRSAGNKILLERGELEPGIYFYQFHEKGKFISRGKIIVH